MLGRPLLPAGRIVIAAAFLFVQAIAVSWIRQSENLPVPPDLEHFPSTMGDWKKVGEDSIETSLQLGADRVVSWNYVHASSGSTANWFVAWFQTQRDGNQPHSPKVCLPGNGWTPQTADELLLSTSAGTVKANRYIVSRGPLRAVVVYWFQTPRRVIANEWAAKFWLVVDSVRDHRTDTALARVVVFERNGDDAATSATAVQFAEEALNALRTRLY